MKDIELKSRLKAHAEVLRQSVSAPFGLEKIIEESKVPIAIENYLKNHPEIKKIVLCLDNDAAGRNATKALKTVLQNEYEIFAD